MRLIRSLVIYFLLVVAIGAVTVLIQGGVSALANSNCIGFLALLGVIGSASITTWQIVDARG